MSAVSTYSPTSDAYVNGVLSGIKWATGSLSFSFPSSASLYGGAYGSGEPSNNFEAFTALQQNAVRGVLQTFSSVTNITFTEVTETSTQHGDLRYAESDAPSTAWAYYPSTSALGGDVWANNSRNYYDNPLKGTYGYQTFLHETGHAMGLKHPQDAKGRLWRHAGRPRLARIHGDELSLLCRGAAYRIHRRLEQLPADADDVRHRRAPAALRRELHHECRQQRLHMEPADAARCPSTAWGRARPPATRSS